MKEKNTQQKDWRVNGLLPSPSRRQLSVSNGAPFLRPAPFPLQRAIPCRHMLDGLLHDIPVRATCSPSLRPSLIKNASSSARWKSCDVRDTSLGVLFLHGDRSLVKLTGLGGSRPLTAEVKYQANAERCNF